MTQSISQTLTPGFYYIDTAGQQHTVTSVLSLLPQIPRRIIAWSQQFAPELHEKAIKKITTFEQSTVANMPNLIESCFKKIIGVDKLIGYTTIVELHQFIDRTFQPIRTFIAQIDRWLANENAHKNPAPFKDQLLALVARLPVHTARQIIQLVYDIIATTAHTIVHPADASIKLAKNIVDLIYALTKPETWTRVGAGLVGSSVGQIVVSSNPISGVLFGIGIAALLGGLTIGSVKAAIQKTNDSTAEVVKAHLRRQTKPLVTVLLNSFCVGLLIGGIQRVVQARQTASFRIADQQAAEEWANRYVTYHKYPQYKSASYASPTEVDIEWTRQAGQYLETVRPEWHGSLGLRFSPAARHHYPLYENRMISIWAPIIGLLTGQSAPKAAKEKSE